MTVLRPFNTYGPRQSARAVIPTIVTQIAAKAKRIRLGSLHPTRDFCFVRDTARAFAAALDADAAAGEVINVATGHEISIGELAALIAGLMRADIEIATEAERVRPQASEVERLCGANAKAARLLGWQPEYGGRDGLAPGSRGDDRVVRRPRQPGALPARHLHAVSRHRDTDLEFQTPMRAVVRSSALGVMLAFA